MNHRRKPVSETLLIRTTVFTLFLLGFSLVSNGQFKDTIYFERKDFLHPPRVETVFIPPNDTLYLIVNILDLKHPWIKHGKEWFALKDCAEISFFIKKNRTTIPKRNIVVLGDENAKYADYKCVIDAFKENDIFKFELAVPKENKKPSLVFEAVDKVDSSDNHGGRHRFLEVPILSRLF